MKPPTHKTIETKAKQLWDACWKMNGFQPQDWAQSQVVLDELLGSDDPELEPAQTWLRKALGLPPFPPGS